MYLCGEQMKLSSGVSILISLCLVSNAIFDTWLMGVIASNEKCLHLFILLFIWNYAQPDCQKGSPPNTLWCVILFASEILICIFSIIWIYIHTSPNTNVHCDFVLGLEWAEWLMTYWEVLIRFAYSIMIPCKIWAFTFPLHTVAMMLIRFETIGDTNFWCDVDYWLFLGLSVFEEYNAQVFLSTYYVFGDACKQKMLSNVQ